LIYNDDCPSPLSEYLGELVKFTIWNAGLEEGFLALGFLGQDNIHYLGNLANRSKSVSLGVDGIVEFVKGADLKKDTCFSTVGGSELVIVFLIKS
jgi:hypothetical protein